MALVSCAVARSCLNSGTALSAEIVLRFSRPRSSSTLSPDNGLAVSRFSLRPFGLGGTLELSAAKGKISEHETEWPEYTFFDICGGNQLFKLRSSLLFKFYRRFGVTCEDFSDGRDRLGEVYSSPAHCLVDSV